MIFFYCEFPTRVARCKPASKQKLTPCVTRNSPGNADSHTNTPAKKFALQKVKRLLSSRYGHSKSDALALRTCTFLFGSGFLVPRESVLSVRGVWCGDTPRVCVVAATFAEFIRRRVSPPPGAECAKCRLPGPDPDSSPNSGGPLPVARHFRTNSSAPTKSGGVSSPPAPCSAVHRTEGLKLGLNV